MSDDIKLGKAKIDIEASNLSNLTNSIATALSSAIVTGAKSAMRQIDFSRYGKAASDLADRLGVPAYALGADKLAEYAAGMYRAGYNPSKIQTAVHRKIEREFDATIQRRGQAFTNAEGQPIFFGWDRQYLNAAEQATRYVAKESRRNKYLGTAGRYGIQLQSVLSEIINEPDLAKKRSLANRALSLVRSIGSNQMVKVGAISPTDAATSLSLATQLRGIVNAQTPEEMAVAEAELSAAQATQRSREVDKAWAAHNATQSATNKLYYQQTKAEIAQKNRDMERGFRAMGKGVSADVYDVNKDPDVIRQDILASIDSATAYLNRASTYEYGSVRRRGNIKLAQRAMAGLSGKLENSGLDNKTIAEGTFAIVELTDRIKKLNENVEPISKTLSVQQIGRVGVAAVNAIDKGVAGYYDIRAEQIRPYNLRRDVYQNWAHGTGVAGMGVGVGLMAANPAIGAVVAGLSGLVTLIAAVLKGEKKAGQAAQTEAKAFLYNQSVYGMSGTDFAYARSAGLSGFASTEDFIGMKASSAMLPGALAFGAVSEQQMMAYSLMPNYYRAQLNGASVSEQAAAFKADMSNLPAEYRPYIASIAPGAGLNMLAYTSSGSYDVFSSGEQLYKLHGQLFESKAPRLSLTADINSMKDRFVAKSTWDTAVDNYGEGNSYPLGYAPTTHSPLHERYPWLPNDRIIDNKLGDIIVNIDGSEVFKKGYTFDDFLKNNIMYNVTGI